MFKAYFTPYSITPTLQKTILYTLKNQRLKITQLEKAPFIKVNEINLTKVELF